MKESRAIVVLFSGGEPSEQALRSIHHSLMMDDGANAQSVSILTYNRKDIAGAIMNTVSNLAHDENGPIKVVIRQSAQPTSEIEDALRLVSTHFGDESHSRFPNVVTMVAGYLADDDVRRAFDVIASTSDSELSTNQLYTKSISRSFVNRVREIVKNVSR